MRTLRVHISTENLTSNLFHFFPHPWSYIPGSIFCPSFPPSQALDFFRLSSTLLLPLVKHSYSSSHPCSFANACYSQIISTILVADLGLAADCLSVCYQILVKQEIELFTAKAWFTENKELEAKVISIPKSSLIITSKERNI